MVQFDNIYHNAEAHVGKLRLTQGGLGWKAQGGEGASAHTLQADLFKRFQWIKVARGFQLRISLDEDSSDVESPRDCFSGFHKDDFDSLSRTIRDFYDSSLEQVEVSTRGWNWGKAKIEDADVRFYVKDKLAFEMPVDAIANSNIAGKTEVSMEFVNPEQQEPATNTGAVNGATNASGKGKKSKADQLVEMRLHIPGTVDAEGSGNEDEEADTAANAFHEAIKKKADIGQVAGDGIIVFKEVLVLTPRGRYDVDMFPTFLRLRGKTYDYKVLYSSITKLFLLPKPDDVHVQFVIGLDPPIRQGQTRYPYLVFQFPREEEMDAELNLDEETIQEKYEGKLKKRYEEPTFRIVTSLFKVLSNQKLTVPGNFSSTSEQSSVKCNVKANEGLLYPLDKVLLWVSKQPISVPYSDVHQIVFSRVGSGGAVAGVTSSKTFDLKVHTRSGPEHTFASIQREEHDKLNAYFADRKLRIKNEMNEDLSGAAAAALLGEESDEEMDDGDSDSGQRRAKKKAVAAGGEMDDDDDDDEEDEDFQADSSDDGGSPSEASDEEDGNGGGGSDAGSDSDSAAPKKKKQKK